MKGRRLGSYCSDLPPGIVPPPVQLTTFALGFSSAPTPYNASCLSIRGFSSCGYGIYLLPELKISGIFFFITVSIGSHAPCLAHWLLCYDCRRPLVASKPPSSQTLDPRSSILDPSTNEKETNRISLGFGETCRGDRSCLVVALSYGAASMAMVFINKAVIMQYAYSMTLLTLQQLAAALLIHFGRVMGYTSSKGINMDTAKRLFPVSLFYNANVLFALASLKGVNIPMYIALKRLTPLAVLIHGYFSGKKRPTTQVTLSVVLTAAGVVIAALGDFSFDLYGYSMALVSVFFQTIYLVLVEKSGAEDGLSSVDIMFYNSFLSLPFLIVLILITGEFPNSLSILFAKSDSFIFLAILILSLVMGILLNFTMFLCTIVNSALTTTIVGVLKGVGSTTLGFFVLGGVEAHVLNVSGLVINTAGGVWYSYSKYCLKMESKLPRFSLGVKAHRRS